jgi:hypothetical protein
MIPPIDTLLAADEPWARYRTRVDLLGAPPDDPEVVADRAASLTHPLVRAQIDAALSWPGPVLKRHNQADHPLHALGLAADLGLTDQDDEARELADRLLANCGDDGLPCSWIEVPKAFKGTGEPAWDWMLCDTPLVLDAAQRLGAAGDERVLTGLDALCSLSRAEGWGCASTVPRFRGPGRKADPCPYANLVALCALSHSPPHRDSPAARAGAEALLGHWERRGQRKLYMFGIGTTFQRLKYPLVWYDLLHVLDVLTRFEWTHGDPRLHEMLDLLAGKADETGQYKPESVWMAFKGFDFAQKRGPSPMLTVAAWRIRQRVAA